VIFVLMLLISNSTVTGSCLEGTDYEEQNSDRLLT
jgi:hypothetical protein